MTLTPRLIHELVTRALAEDIGTSDLSGLAISVDVTAEARFVLRRG